MSLQNVPAPEYFFNFTFQQTNFLYIRDLLRYVTIYKPDSLFVILGINNIPKKFEKYQIKSELISDGIITAKTRFIKGNREVFLKLCSEGKTVHLLDLEKSKSCFKWLESNVGADVAIFRKHCMSISVTSTLNEVELRYDRPVTIIFAGYGMGKTTTLHHIQKTLLSRNKNAFILYVNDIELQKFHQKNSVLNLRNFVDFFAVDLINSDVHIMYDNFEHLKECDSIINIMEDFHLNYRGVKQWITCSEIDCRNKLESKLGTFSCFLAPVSYDLQLTYLKNVWNIENNEHNEYIDSVLRQCNLCHWEDIRNITYDISRDACDFSYYPLHLKMIGAKFRPLNNSKVSDISLLDVYEHFVGSYYTNIENIEELAVIKLFEIFNIEHEFTSNNNVTFELVNVRNYLAAKWFSRNFHKYKSELKLLLQRKVGRWSFVHFFNSFLCRGKKLHLAVLNRGDYLSACNEMTVNEKDSGGRTAIHLVEDMYTIYHLIRRGAQIDEKDEVLQWTPLQYCDFLGKWNCLEVLLEHNAAVAGLTWTLSLSEPEISKIVEFSFTTSPKLPFYFKFICENFKHFQVTEEEICEAFYGIPDDVRMMLLSHAVQSNTFHVCYWGKTALFYAVEYNHIDCVKFLINNLGFDIHHKSYTNTTPFLVACEKGFVDIAEYLLDLGADINAVYGENNSNAFFDCCKTNNVEVMEMLVRRGIDTTLNLKSEESPLEVACNNGSDEIVRYLLKNNANLNISKEIDYDKLLHGAVVSKSKDLVELLLNQGNVNINKKYDGTTFLHLACDKTYNFDMDIINLLIQGGADVNGTDSAGCTPIYKILQYDNVEIVDIFAESGCNLLHCNNKGETVLHDFCRKCFEIEGDYFYHLSDLIKQLIFHGAEVDARTPCGDTPLHVACRTNVLELVKCLVSEGADIHAVNNDGETPLHLAALKHCFDYDSDIKTCKYLTMKGADVNQRTYSGKTPIMYAVNHDPNIKELLDLGADIFCKDNDNRTLVHYFVEKGLNPKILANLGLKNAKTVDSFGQTALHFAAKDYNYDSFKYLIKNFDVDINIMDNNGKTAMDLLTDAKRQRYNS